MGDPLTKIKSVVYDNLSCLGYSKNLLHKDYSFDDATTVLPLERKACIAAFAQSPPSYRNACIGVVEAQEKHGIDNIINFLSLGAPLFLELYPDHVKTYYAVNIKKVTYLETIPIARLQQAFEKNSERWSPNTIFRAKALGAPPEHIQLDFVDAGFLPALRGVIHEKLNRILDDILVEAISEYRKRFRRPPDSAELFRLLFRLLAAKVFCDRGHPGNWGVSDSGEIVRQIQTYYGFSDKRPSGLIEDFATQQLIWEKFRSTFSFKNLSVDDLAFVYENTFVQKETRKKWGIHSTPPSIAEILVDRLPMVEVPQLNRAVLEPCAGHGAFLVAAMMKLRDLLPSDWTDKRKHSYLQKRLIAIESDLFAIEVCRLSLTLADYPNPNGWKLINEDIFLGDSLEKILPHASIVLCNPPFEDFTKKEKTIYGDRVRSMHKPYEVLHRILNKPPAMLGFVLPKSAIIGQRYIELQDTIARNYKEVEIFNLPDSIFAHSDEETALLVAFSLNADRKGIVRTNTYWVHENKKDLFINKRESPRPTQRIINRSMTNNKIVLHTPALHELWDTLKLYPRLGDVCDIHRGIEWNIPFLENRKELISDTPAAGFMKGLDKVKDKLEPFAAHNFVYLNTEEKYKRTNAHDLNWNLPKVIANQLVKSRGPWRIVGYPDRNGLVCYQTFYGIWPKNDISVELIAALINSPMINAFLWVREAKKHNKKITLFNAPIPSLDNIDSQAVAGLVSEYKYIFENSNLTLDATRMENARQILLKIDAAILRSYDLPPRLEKILLDVFSGYERPVPFMFNGYFPDGFSINMSLSEYLRFEDNEHCAKELLHNIIPVNSEQWHEAVLEINSWKS